MPVKVGVAYVDILPDLTRFGAELKHGINRDLTAATEKASASMKTSLAGAAKAAAGVFAGVKITDFLKGGVQAASDLTESLSKSAVVFGSLAGGIDKWAQGAASSLGLSRQEATEAAATFGNMFGAMGLGERASAGMSKSIVELASDLASFNNIPIPDVLDRLRSGLLGEQEAVERLGINMSETRLKAKALELGLGDGKKVLDATAKAQAAYAIILEDTKNAQGDFARTSGNLANQQRQLTANMENLQATLGQALVPALARGSDVLNDLLGTFNELPGPIREAAAGLALLAGAVSAAGLAAGILGPKIAAARLELEAMGAAGAVANKSISALAVVGKGLAAVAIPVGAAAALNSQINKMTGNVKKLAEATDEELLPAFDRVRQSRNLLDRTVELMGDVDLYSRAEENQAAFKKVIESGNLALARRILVAVKGRDVEEDLQKIWDDQAGTLQQLNADQEETSRILGEIVGNGKAAAATYQDVADAALGLAGAERSAAQAARAVARADQDLADARADLNQLLRDGAVDEEKIAEARERLAGATRSLDDAQRGLGKAQKEYDQALAAANILGTDTANDELADAAENLADANDAVADAAARRKEAEGDLAKAKAGDPDYQNKLADARLRVEDATLGVTDAEYAQAQQAYLVEEATKKANEALADNAENIGKIRGEWEQLLKQQPAIEKFLSGPLGLLMFGPPAGGSPLITSPPAPAGGLLGSAPTAPGFGVAGAVPSTTTTTTTQQTITVNNTFNEKADPALIGKHIAWQLK